MKKISAIAAGFAVLVIFVACGSGAADVSDVQPDVYYSPIEQELSAQYEVAESEPCEPVDFPVESWRGLNMYAAAGGVTPTGLRLSMANESDTRHFGHGAPFTIEQYLGGDWERVPFISENVAWFSLLFIIFPDAVADEDITWAHMHGELEPGQYRVVRRFTEENWGGRGQIMGDNPAAYLYAAFTVEENWQDAYGAWQREQDELAAVAFGRFAGLDLEIAEHSARGLSFSLTNNNADYGYIINSVFVGWEMEFPDGGNAGGVEYSIFSEWVIGGNLAWPFGNDKRLQPGEYFSLDVNWYTEIGELHSGMMPLDSPHPYIFDLVLDVTLDVDEDYIAENFRRRMPNVPAASHRLRAEFDISQGG
ncbi:MAG: hypothetical protein FWB96_06585 [Defluviitaleaceae bacterium]|nr:hypothetical protein [Defluviitaleaceae bacterium]MCL2263331.1 hypothetical protein [Defluviitaleaceae bacterium]